VKEDGTLIREGGFVLLSRSSGVDLPRVCVEDHFRDNMYAIRIITMKDKVKRWRDQESLALNALKLPLFTSLFSTLHQFREYSLKHISYSQQRRLSHSHKRTNPPHIFTAISSVEGTEYPPLQHVLLPARRQLTKSS
jgi:hypothetical protein